MPSSDLSFLDALKTRPYYEHIGIYYKPCIFKALSSFFVTVALLYITLILESINYFLTVLMIILRTLLYVRMFVLMHDNGHESLFKSKRLNDISGIILGCLLGVDFFNWRENHNNHHQITNDSRYFQQGQSAPLSLTKLKSMKSNQQKLYLFLFSTPSMIFILPTLYRIINIITMIYKNKMLFGLFLIIQKIKFNYFSFWNDQIALELGAFIGLLFFNAQHTFKELKRRPQITHLEQGLLGATYLELPEWMKFFSFGIEYHHIHHLNAKVPGYLLRECHEKAEEKDKKFWELVHRVGLKNMIDFNYIIYDDILDRLISRKELKNLYNI